MARKTGKATIAIAVMILASVAISARSAIGENDQGKVLYGAHCQQCHGSLGDGKGPLADNNSLQPMDFTSQKMSEISDARIERAVLAGLPTVPAHSWGTILSNEEVAALISHVRSFKR